MNGFHDLVDIPGWTHGSQVRAAFGVNKIVIGTVVNSLFPGVAAALAIYYWHSPAPRGVRNFWLIYCAVVVMGAIAMWWIPYFRGTDQKTKDRYSKMCAGTIQVLPPRGDNLYSLSRAAPAGSDHPEDQSQGLGLVVVLTEGKVSWTTQ